MKVLYIMVGIPGSGKTTYASKLEAARVSFDDIREKLYGNANVKGKEEEIKKEFEIQINQILRDNQSMVIDYQGLTPKSRKSFISRFKIYFDKIIAIYIKTPLEVCINHNNSRERHVPEYVIKNSFNTLIPPSIEEGFDEIICVESKDAVIL